MDGQRPEDQEQVERGQSVRLGEGEVVDLTADDLPGAGYTWVVRDLPDGPDRRRGRGRAATGVGRRRWPGPAPAAPAGRPGGHLRAAAGPGPAVGAGGHATGRRRRVAVPGRSAGVLMRHRRASPVPGWRHDLLRHSRTLRALGRGRPGQRRHQQQRDRADRRRQVPRRPAGRGAQPGRGGPRVAGRGAGRGAGRRARGRPASTRTRSAPSGWTRPGRPAPTGSSRRKGVDELLRTRRGAASTSGAPSRRGSGCRSSTTTTATPPRCTPTTPTSAPTPTERSSVSAIVGTGLGGGVVEAAGWSSGAAGMAGELGHVHIPMDGLLERGPADAAVQLRLRGDAESVASLTGIEKQPAAVLADPVPRPRAGRGRAARPGGQARCAAYGERGRRDGAEGLRASRRWRSAGCSRSPPTSPTRTPTSSAAAWSRPTPTFRDWFLGTVREHTELRDEQARRRHVRARPRPGHGRRPRCRGRRARGRPTGARSTPSPVRRPR